MKFIDGSIALSLLCEALAAVNRSVLAGLERNASLAAAACTYGSEHFLGGLVLSGIAAVLASLGLVLESLFCVELLLACCEYELVTAVLAN